MAGICCLILYLYNQANSIERLETAAIQVECHQRIAGKVEGYLSKHFDNIMKKNLLLIVGIVFFYSCNGVQFDSGFGDELYSKMESFLDNPSMMKTVLPILLLVLCILLFVLYLYLYIKSKQSLEWYNVKGTILKSELDDLRMRGGEPSSYKAKIEYSYTVDDKTYHSKKIFYGDFLRHTSVSSSKKLIEIYKEGDVVNVFYNPHNPK